MPSAKANLLTELTVLSDAIGNMRWDITSRMPDSDNACTLAVNQHMLDAHAKDVMSKVVAVLGSMGDAGSSVDLPKHADSNMFDALSDAFDDATAKAWERTRENASEEARGVAA